MERGTKKWIWAAFVLYCAIMVWLLFGQRLGDPLTEGALAGASRLNLSPFHMIRHYVRLIALSDKPYLVRSAAVNLAGNVAVFVPLGIFLPWLWPPMGKIWLFLPFVLALIAAVEAVQYATYLGVCDIDDLILNAVGCLIGWALYMLARRMYRKQK